jgi:hypothetical protein
MIYLVIVNGRRDNLFGHKMTQNFGLTRGTQDYGLLNNIKMLVL